MKQKNTSSIVLMCVSLIYVPLPDCWIFILLIACWFDICASTWFSWVLLIIVIYLWTLAPIFSYLFFASAMLQLIDVEVSRHFQSSRTSLSLAPFPRGIFRGLTGPRGTTICFSCSFSFPCMWTCFDQGLGEIDHISCGIQWFASWCFIVVITPASL